MFKHATVVLKEAFSGRMGQRMGQALVAKLGQRPDACWIFSSPESGLEELLCGIAETVGTQNLVGCTTDGEISSGGLSTRSAVLGGIVSDQIAFHVAYAENIGADSERAGRKLGKSLPNQVSYLQLFTDGLTGNACAMLRGVTSVLGDDFPIAGGTAGDNGKFQQTWQFASGRFLSDAAVAIAFVGDLKVGTGVGCGWSPVGIAKKITRSKDNVLYELNGEPALKVYERFLGKHAAKLPSIGVEYPLGVVGHWDDDTPESEYLLLRATMAVNSVEGSISFGGELPEGATVYLTCGDRASIINAADNAVHYAKAQLEGRQPVMAFCFSCMARKLVLGRRTEEELATILHGLGPALPLIGFYTYGEYGQTKPGSTCLFHNETATISIIGI